MSTEKRRIAAQIAFLAGIFCLIVQSAVAQVTTLELKRLHLLGLKGLEMIQQRSIDQNREYCGLIVRSPEGELEIWRTVAGEQASCTVPEAPLGYEEIASFHTHGPHDRRYDAEVPSTTDLRVDFERGTYGYVGTPAGRVWLVDPFAQWTYQLCAKGCITADPRYNARHTADLQRSYTLEELIARQE